MTCRAKSTTEEFGYIVLLNNVDSSVVRRSLPGFSKRANMRNHDEA